MAELSSLAATGAVTSPEPAAAANFDSLARSYRRLELLTFGRALERCRTRLLPAVRESREALLLGDGDGRFLAELLRRSPALRATAVDTSAAMLRELRARCAQCSGRVQTVHSDALRYLRDAPAGLPDLLVTHFLLDCLTQPECEQLAATAAARAVPGTLWLVSEFRVPPGLRGLGAWILVRGLYMIFGWLTGLRVRRLPDHVEALARAGWVRLRCEPSLGGLLTAELWQHEGGLPRPL